MDAPQMLSMFVQCLGRGDWDGLARLVADDYVEEWPQTGEVVRGVDNVRAILEHYPGRLESGALDMRTASIVGAEDRFVLAAAMTPRWIRVAGAGEMYTLTYVADYPDGSRWYVVMVARVAGGRIRHARTYFAPKMDPPQWRRAYVELVQDERERNA